MSLAGLPGVQAFRPNLLSVVLPDGQDIVRPVSDPITPTGGVVGLKGNLAPEGAIVKVAGMEKTS